MRAVFRFFLSSAIAALVFTLFFAQPVYAQTTTISISLMQTGSTVPVVFTGNTTAGNAVNAITSPSNWSILRIGSVITGAGIPTGTYITYINQPLNVISLSAAPTATATGVSFTEASNGMPMPYGTVCAYAVGAQGGAINISETGWGFVPAHTQFCGTLASGTVPGGIPVPDSLHSNLAAPFNYNFVIQQTDASGDPIGLPIQINNVAGVTGTTWALDQYAPPVTAPALSPTVGYGSVPSSCTAPSIWTDTSGNAYVCHASTYLAISGSAFNGGTVANPIVLPADPTTALQAATKQYVDAHAGSATGVIPSAQGGVDKELASTAIQAQTIQDFGGNFNRIQTGLTPSAANGSSFTDGTPFVTAGVPYSTYISDFAITCINQPGLCGPVYTSSGSVVNPIKNMLAKFFAQVSSGSTSPAYGTNTTFSGAIPQTIFRNGSVYSYCSGGDSVICHYPVGDGAFFAPQLEELYYLQTGDSSEFSADATKLDTGMSITPLDSTTGIPVSLKYPSAAGSFVGSEWVPWAFFEEIRYTGLITHAAALEFRAATAASYMYGVIGNGTLQTKYANIASKIQANMTTASPLWDAANGMFFMDTGNNSTIDDIAGSAMACYSDPYMHIPQMATNAQCTAISSYISAHYSTIVTSQGYVQSFASTPPYTGNVLAGGSYGGNGSVGCYQLGAWSMVNYDVASVLNITDPTHAAAMLNAFTTGTNPQMENYGTGSCAGTNGNAQNLESPTWAARYADENPGEVTISTAASVPTNPFVATKLQINSTNLCGYAQIGVSAVCSTYVNTFDVLLGPIISGDAPGWAMVMPTAPTDQKLSDTTTDPSGNIAMRLLNDANSDANNWMTLTRVGYVPQHIDFPEPIHETGLTTQIGPQSTIMDNGTTGGGGYVAIEQNATKNLAGVESLIDPTQPAARLVILQTGSVLIQTAAATSGIPSWTTVATLH
jgi:hypothetical protein